MFTLMSKNLKKLLIMNKCSFCIHIFSNEHSDANEGAKRCWEDAAILVVLASFACLGILFWQQEK